jgi:hypothetical protein
MTKLTIEKPQIEQAILDYCAKQSPAENARLISLLETNPDFYVAMGKALSEAALYIAGSAVITDELEFQKMKRRVLFESRMDGRDVAAFRHFYLTDRNEIDVSCAIVTPEQEAMFAARLEHMVDCYEILRRQIPVGA